VETSDPLWPVREALLAAFPNGVAGREYEMLLRVLTAEMSFRAVARAIAETFGREQLQVMHDAYGVQSIDWGSAEVQRIRERLAVSGLTIVPADVER
jgi:hypothetical protein